MFWWEIIPEGVPVKLSKREEMPGGQRCQGGEYVLAKKAVEFIEAGDFIMFVEVSETPEVFRIT